MKSEAALPQEETSGGPTQSLISLLTLRNISVPPFLGPCQTAQLLYREFYYLKVSYCQEKIGLNCAQKCFRDVRLDQKVS